MSMSACTSQFQPLSGSASAYAVSKHACTRSTPEVLQFYIAAAADDMVCMPAGLVEVVYVGRMTVLVCKVCMVGRLADRSAHACTLWNHVSFPKSGDFLPSLRS